MTTMFQADRKKQTKQTITTKVCRRATDHQTGCHCLEIGNRFESRFLLQHSDSRVRTGDKQHDSMASRAPLGCGKQEIPMCMCGLVVSSVI